MSTRITNIIDDIFECIKKLRTEENLQSKSLELRMLERTERLRL